MNSRPNFLRSKRGMMAVAAIVLILFLFRPGVYRLRNRIATSIGSALGRRVALDNVRVHILPRPGFDLEGLVIYDDPDFSAEPMIRAQDVSAAIRFRSLFRGRLEIAALSASEPSINLVRNQYGRWNLASLLERNAQIPAAPTEKRPFERRPAFPYLEASHARINFKIGQTKKPYALVDADVALWQDSENSWSARIKGAPVRTDFNLTDTGTLTVEGTWQRAPSLRLTPLQLGVQWQNGQLGQITKLLSGKDPGWRGGVGMNAQLSGTPEALKIESQIAVDGFHRYDIAGSDNLRLASACSAQYNSATSAVSDLLCQSPVSGGNIRVRGSAALVEQTPTYDLTVAAENVPVAPMLRLLRQAKKYIPVDLTASGSLNATFHLTRAQLSQQLSQKSSQQDHDALPRVLQTVVQTWNGIGTVTNVHLSTSATNFRNPAKPGKDDIAFATVPLALIGSTTITPITTGSAATAGRSKRHGEQKDGEPAEANLRIGPSMLAMNSSAPLTAGGWISAAGYHFFLRGDTELKDVFRFENMLGVPGPRPAAQGLAKLDVIASGQWKGFPAPVTTGTILLRSVRAEVRGLNTPIQIASATITLTADELSVQKLSAHTGAAPAATQPAETKSAETKSAGTQWTGTIAAPRHCNPTTATPAATLPGSFAFPNCVFQFDLTADELSAADLAAWLTPHPANRPWYRILDSASTTNSNNPPARSPLLALRARGSLHMGRLILKNVIVSELVTQLDVDRGKITLENLRGKLLQGTHRGNWVLYLNDDLNDDSNDDLNNALVPTKDSNPVAATGMRFHGSGTLHDISLDQIATLMNDAWISGTADGVFVFESSDFRDLPSHSTGKLDFVMRNGSLPHIQMPDSPAPLPVRRFAGELFLKEGTWQVLNGKLESSNDTYQVSGTASAGRVFDFLLSSSSNSDEQSWKITGTLAEPRVSASDRAETRAAEAERRSGQR